MPDEAVRSAQRLRLRRFVMALSTYAVVVLAAGLMTQLGLGEMSTLEWTVFIGLGLLGNTVFLVLFLTNANLRFSDPSLTREQIVYSAFWGLVPLYALPEARPVMLMFYLPAFNFGILRLTRRQYLGVTAAVMGLYASLLVVEYTQGRRGFSIRYELFLFVLFGIVLSWFAVFGGFVSSMRQRMRAQKNVIQRANEEISAEVEERRRAQIEKDELIVELRDAIARVKTLSGLLPICAACKRIRDDKGYWNQIESYLRDHSEAEFSHGICPECFARLYPEHRMSSDKD